VSWFIDKLSMHQEYADGGLPLIGKHGVLRYDIATGDIISDTVNSGSHEGSYSSKIQIRCNGSSVSVSGNPSRFNRPDNLYGFTTIDDCVAVYNQILIGLGLPPFAKATSHGYRQSKDGKATEQIIDGAIIRSIDWTRNLAVGQGNEHAFLRALSSQTIGRGLQPHLYPNGYTVDWGTQKSRYQGRGSTYRYDKVYIKAQDLITHRAQRLKGESQDDIRYYNRLIEYCQDLGIVREEQSKKAPWLKKHGTLAYYGLCNESAFLPHLNDIEAAIARMEVHQLSYETISEQLIASGVCSSVQSANATDAIYQKWLHGTPLNLKKSQYYTHKSRLLQIGVDISMPHDTSRMSPQIKRGELITVAPAEAPTWYRQPSIRALRAA
jgi:hypothetical protein